MENLSFRQFFIFATFFPFEHHQLGSNSVACSLFTMRFDNKVLTLTLVALLGYCATVNGAVAFTGVNLSGGEFGTQPTTSNPNPGSQPTNYIFPNSTCISYWIKQGITIARLPFFWERLQATADGSFDPTYFGYIDACVSQLTAGGVVVVLDAHSDAGATYFGNNLSPTGSPSYANFANFWSQLASIYKNNSRVWFGLINEPHNINTTIWLGAANAAIAGIRGTGNTNRIMVAGNYYTGAHDWTTANGWGLNSQVMLGVHDSGNNFLFEVHQYFDSNFSGTSTNCDSAYNGTALLVPFTNWARANGYKAYLGEFGAPNTPDCERIVNEALTYMAANTDVWEAWTWWVAGTAWTYYGTNYPYSIEPTTEGVNQPQLAWLTPFFGTGGDGDGDGGGSSGGDGSSSGGGSSTSGSNAAGSLRPFYSYIQ